MNILMMTNTYKPIVGGIENSIENFSVGYRARGHKVLIVAPVFKNMPEEEGVHRIPAIQNFNGTDFSIEVPIPGILNDVLEKFAPDIVHSHHPFLIGDTALRISAGFNIPIIFTHHTVYEKNTHYVPGDSEVLQEFVIKLAVGYANLCNNVIAPSESIEKLLKERGVLTDIITIPTGIEVSSFSSGDGTTFRKKWGIPPEAFLVGYIGRLAEEKNMIFLLDAVISFMKHEKNACFLIVGDGDLKEEMQLKIKKEGIEKRVYFTGFLKGQKKVDAYHSMDAFVFASKSETQGIVLVEAMASKVPVIGLDAPGTREVIEDGANGYLLFDEDRELFAEKLREFCKLDADGKTALKNKANITADKFDRERSIEKTLDMYKEAIRKKDTRKGSEEDTWASAKRAIKKETEILTNIVRSVGTAFNSKGKKDEKRK